MNCPEGEEWAQECASEGLGPVSTSVNKSCWVLLCRPSPACFTGKGEGSMMGGCNLQARPCPPFSACDCAGSLKGSVCASGWSRVQKLPAAVFTPEHVTAGWRLLWAMPTTNSRSFSGNWALPGYKDTLVMFCGTASSSGAWGKMPETPSGDLLLLAQERGATRCWKHRVKCRKFCAMTWCKAATECSCPATLDNLRTSSFYSFRLLC